MPPRKRKTRGKKRRSGTKGKKYPKTFKRLMGKMYRGAKKRGSSAARYARRNPGRIAGGVAGAGALGLAGYEGYLAAKRGLDPYSSLQGKSPYASPTAAAFRRGRRGARAGLQTAGTHLYNAPGVARGYAGSAYDAVTGANYRSWPKRGWDATKAAPGAAWKGAKKLPGKARKTGSGLLDRLFPGRVTRRTKRKVDAQRRAFNAASGTMPGDTIGSPYGYGYGKRRRRRRKKRSFGKKAKKPSAALKRMCKKHKVRLTLKRGKKRVYKSEAMLKKQCKKAMKRRKKSKK